MKVKCINCIYMGTVDSDIYDGDHSRHHITKYICQQTNIERDILSNRDCPCFSKASPSINIKSTESKEK